MIQQQWLAVWDDNGDDRPPDFMGYVEIPIAALLPAPAPAPAESADSAAAATAITDSTVTGGGSAIALRPPPLVFGPAGRLVVERAVAAGPGEVKK